MILLAFFLSLVPWSLQIFFWGPSLPILAFIPFIALSLLSCTFSQALFLSTATGLLVDLLSADPFGIHALNHAATCFFCYRGRTFFSAESPLQFSLYTAICSFISDILQISFLFLFDRRVFFQGTWWLTDWTMLPLLNALYALCWLTGPIKLYRIARRLWGFYWARKKKLFLK